MAKQMDSNGRRISVDIRRRAAELDERTTSASSTRQGRPHTVPASAHGELPRRAVPRSPRHRLPLLVRHSARQRRLSHAAHRHVLSHVLRVREPGLRSANSPQGA